MFLPSFLIPPQNNVLALCLSAIIFKNNPHARRTFQLLFVLLSTGIFHLLIKNFQFSRQEFSQLFLLLPSRFWYVTTAALEKGSTTLFPHYFQVVLTPHQTAGTHIINQFSMSLRQQILWLRSSATDRLWLVCLLYLSFVRFDLFRPTKKQNSGLSLSRTNVTLSSPNYDTEK